MPQIRKVCWRHFEVVLVDEFRTTAGSVSNTVSAQAWFEYALDQAVSFISPACQEEEEDYAGPSTPPGKQREERRAEWKTQRQQRIGESKWRPLELCFWPDQGVLPAKGKEYPGLGYKRLRDKPPKAQQQQPAEAQASRSRFATSL
ncbi:hypothetical protein QJQ45_030192 [Haematococcus lacustris]|nr:hypothetical protein QJQ45_030192 [Haematococcus lacustris]